MKPRLLLLALITLTGINVQASLCGQTSAKFPVPTRTELLDKLWFVHVTQYAPTQGVVYAGFAPGTDRSAAIFRPAVHGALGEMVVSHEKGTWDKSEFAVLLPLKNVEKRLYTLYPQDTTVVGDIVLPANAVVLVPKGFKFPVAPRFKVREWDKDTGTLRQAIDAELKAQGAWTTNAAGGRPKDKVEFQGWNINNPEFFKNLLSSAPGGYREHVHSTQGRLDHDLYVLMNSLKYGNRIEWSPYESDAATISAKMEYAKLVYLAGKYREEVAGLSLIPAERAGIERNLESLNLYFNILKADIQVRNEGLGTIWGVRNTDFMQQIFNLRGDYAQLVDFIRAHRDKLTTPDEGGKYIRYLFWGARSWAEVEAKLRMFPEAIEAYGGMDNIRARAIGNGIMPE